MGVLKMILDTHIFLWWLFDDPKLPQKVRRQLEDYECRVFISAASVWEITTKFRLGKLPEAASVAKDPTLWIDRAGFTPLVITPEHAQLAGSWKVTHRDPFDRMLAAQAYLERMPLISIDRAFNNFPIDLVSK